MIPYSRQTITEDDVQAVSSVLRSSRLTQGPAVEAFENTIAKYCGAKFAVSFNSGTAGLHAAYFAIGLKNGDEIITSPITFAATTNAALWQSAHPVFADIDAHGNIDPRDVVKKITKRTKVIVAVDYAGMPADLDALRKIATKHKLVFIEDAAHSLGATYKGKKIGSHGHMTMFSFHPVKSITTGEGGVIVTNSKEYYEKLKLFRSHGITKDAKLYKRASPGDWYHEMHVLAQNYRMPDILAALGTSQMKKLPMFLKKRAAIAKRYDVLLKNVPNVQLPLVPRDRTSAWHLYPIRVAGKFSHRRAEVFEKLQKAGIGVQVHYIPVYFHPYYEKLGYARGLCPRAEAFYETEISIPIFPLLTLVQQKFVVKTLKDILM